MYNESEDDIKLCKNDTVATLTPIILFEYSQQIPCTVQIDEGIDLLKERSDLSTEQKAKFKAIVGNYVKNVGKNNKSKIQYEHEIKLRDDEPVAVQARRLRYSQRKEIDSQIDFVTKSEWLTRDKLKVAPKNSQVASPFIDEQDPIPSETSDITDTVSSESEDEVVLEGDNIVDQPPRYNRRYNLRPNPHIPQPFGDYYVHCCDVIKNIYFC